MTVRVSAPVLNDVMSAFVRDRSVRGMTVDESGFVLVKKLRKLLFPGRTFGGAAGARVVAASIFGRPRRDLRVLNTGVPSRDSGSLNGKL
jgi:hypothetical protein